MLVGGSGGFIPSYCFGERKGGEGGEWEVEDGVKRGVMGADAGGQS